MIYRLFHIFLPNILTKVYNEKLKRFIVVFSDIDFITLNSLEDKTIVRIKENFTEKLFLPLSFVILKENLLSYITSGDNFRHISVKTFIFTCYGPYLIINYFDLKGNNIPSKCFSIFGGRYGFWKTTKENYKTYFLRKADNFSFHLGFHVDWFLLWETCSVSHFWFLFLFYCVVILHNKWIILRNLFSII